MPKSTIYALSSGRPPAAIAVMRISGPQAGPVLERMTGTVPKPRRATLAVIRDPADADILDTGLILWMPAPDSVTGEDVAEFHLHGGRAVVDAVAVVLARQPGLREAVAGEFTRRAFDHGRIDLNEAEGLADLLEAETQGQRRAALLAAGGVLSRRVEDWRQRLLAISATIEAAIDYSDEDDVGTHAGDDVAKADAAALAAELKAMLALPRAERLRDGIRVVVAGPPNSGKSSLVNALAGRAAAIESPVPGTTRDIIEVPLAIAGIPFLLVDTAGLREAADKVEAAGVALAVEAAASADVVLWLGDDDFSSAEHVIPLYARADIRPAQADRLPVSARTGLNLGTLTKRLLLTAQSLLPAKGDVPLNRRQHLLADALCERLDAIRNAGDPLAAAEEARSARNLCDQLAGRSGVEEMLDSLFARFCIGK